MKRATVYRRSNGWYLHAVSKTTVGIEMGTPPRIKVAIDAPPDALGKAAIEALNGSMQEVPHPPFSELENGFRPMLELAGVKTWAAFARNACNVGIEVDASRQWLMIEPWENAGTKRGFVPMPGVSMRVRMDAPPEEIGEAIQKAMQLCVPQFS
jgi:hypothetical protein